MSDQNSTPATIDEATIDPAIKSYFEQKYAPVVSKRDELLGKLGTYKTLTTELEALGGLDTVKSLKAQADAAAAAAEQERIAALAKDGKITEIEAHYQKLLADKDAKLTSFQQSLVNKDVDAKLAKAIKDEGGNPALLSQILRGRVEASLDANGEIVITVKGEAGQTLGEDGKALTLKSLVAEAKANPDYAGAFAAHQASGAGTRKTTTTSGSNPFATATQSITEQMKLIKSQPELARTLAAEAGVTPTW